MKEIIDCLSADSTPNCVSVMISPADGTAVHDVHGEPEGANQSKHMLADYVGTIGTLFTMDTCGCFGFCSFPPCLFTGWFSRVCINCFSCLRSGLIMCVT